jgi:2-(1,2-epoxy-1,2-dihydrophenyl)acetyl-CoA isomerase
MENPTMEMHGDYRTLTYETAGGIARLTINRPDRRNAMSTEMVAEAYDAVRRAAADTSIRLFVLTGSGNWFCPGADIGGIAGANGSDSADAVDGSRDQSTSTAGGPSATEIFQVPVVLHEMPAVSVALINGSVAGAGLGWACGCDLRVATRSAKFNTAFLDVGVAGDMALPWSLSRLIGAAKLRELMLLPDKISADEAQRIGLVARVFDDVTFRNDAEAIVGRLASASPAALTMMKQNWLDAEKLSFSDYVNAETRRHHHMFTLSDTREAFAAKFEKRAPRFTGQ